MTDSVFQQDPPPYGPPTGLLIVPAFEFYANPPLRQTPPGTPPRASAPFRSGAHTLQFTAVQQPGLAGPASASSVSLSAPGSNLSPPPSTPTLGPRRRSHTINGSPRLRKLRARDSPTPTSVMSAPSSSPPPYSLTPPEITANAEPIGPAKRAASSPHLRLSSGTSPGSPLSSHSHLHSGPYPHTHPHLHSRQAFSEYARARSRSMASTSDDDESGADTDDGVMLRSHGGKFADTLRNRLLGKGKGRAFDEGWSRPITTAPGALCAGETETEGEDSPRNLPTARITRSSLSQEIKLPPFTAWLVPFLFQLFRLLAIVPAVVGTTWCLYRVFRPPEDLNEWRVEYFVSSLWAVLTGWQCLQLTTGLLKRWRVYYSPFATLIRLLGLQAICWPATQLTLTILDHEVRPLICWTVIGTTTCCSRSIQLWVTSNIVPAPLPPGAQPSANGAPDEEHMRKGRRRRWDWGQVGRKCALPAGIVYLIMAWALVLRKEFLGC